MRAATGAHALIPAGLAWQAARGWQPIGARCREVVDAGFDGDDILGGGGGGDGGGGGGDSPPAGAAGTSSSSTSPSLPPIPLSPPLTATAAAAARWSGGEAEGVPLYRDKGPGFTSKYCSSADVSSQRVGEGAGGGAGEPGREGNVDDANSHDNNLNRTVPCHVDHHASAVGMYITAATFFAALTGQSPIGASVPSGERVPFFLSAAAAAAATTDDGSGGGSGSGGGGGNWKGTQRNKVVRLPMIDAADGAAAQRAAEDVVLPHLSTWNPALVR